MTVAAVVLAGGASRRFGTDKLATDVSGRTLLEVAVEALPPEIRVIVVGPPRPLPREVTFIREQPPGGGPAAGLIAGLKVALQAEPDAVVVLPGDAPAAGLSVLRLLEALTGREVVVGADPTGQLQPLQLALTPSAARRLVDLAGPSGAAGQSARRLIVQLDPLPVALPPEQTFDIDTTEQLRAWRGLAAPDPHNQAPDDADPTAARLKSDIDD